MSSRSARRSRAPRIVLAWGWSLFLALVILVLPSPARGQVLSPGPLSQAHAGLEGDQHCNDCHSAGRKISTESCVNKCHSDLGGRIAAGQGLHGREYRGQPCEKCHGEHHGLNVRLVRWPGGDRTNLEHGQTGWPLQHAHKGVGCDKCHNKVNGRGAKTYLGLSTACASCHKDPHAGRFGATCTSCHDETTWSALRLDAFDHGKARFALKGAHTTTACARCHTGQPPKYVGLAFGSCADCHKDAHNGKLGTACASCHVEDGWTKVGFSKGSHPGVSLANGHATVKCATCHDKGNKAPPSRGSACVSCHASSHKAPFGTSCASCHASIQWMGLPRAVGLNAHTRTAYTLRGKHVDVACSGCHKPQLPRNARYRQLQFGKCNDCHADKHDGEFAAMNRSECAYCHSPQGFRPTSFGIAAHARTKFPLDGAHTSVACSGCHEGERPRLDLRVSKQVCADCHKNPHGDQFAAEMKRGGCAECHVTSSFTRAKLDHSTWPLTGAHATAQCESCHHPSAEDRKQGKGASYRGVPRSCGGCHDDVHVAQFRVKAPVYECDKCHTTSVFKIASFDHAAIAAYPLTGGHARVGCERCHAKETLVNGKEAVRWRLPSHECSDCHKNPHGGAR